MLKSLKFLGDLGKRIILLFHYAGGLSILFGKTVAVTFSSSPKRRQIFEQMTRVGIEGLPIVSIVSIFTGMVLAFQTAYQMQKLSAQIYIASLVALSMARELGPVLTALIIAGRNGAAITAELGTMKVTEQVDALKALATDPIQYLVVPRFLALIFMLPILTAYSNIIGVFGGYLVGVYKLGIGSTLYLRMTFEPMVLKDVFTGLLKAFFFGIIIAIVSCFEGLQVTGGAEGVGRATTITVVTSFIMIIAADCLFTAIFFFMF